MRRKAEKLEPYRTRGKRTVLLLDSGDIALMSVDKLVAAIRARFQTGLPDGVDELWYADTSVPSVLEFCDIKAILAEHDDAV